MPPSGKVVFSGTLEIDTRGTIMFKDNENRTLLRVTHLRTPVPAGTHIIDMAAVEDLLSYTPLREQS